MASLCRDLASLPPGTEEIAVGRPFADECRRFQMGGGEREMRVYGIALSALVKAPHYDAELTSKDGRLLGKLVNRTDKDGNKRDDFGPLAYSRRMKK